MSAGSLIRDVVTRQRRRVVFGVLGWTSHQTCEALVPVAIGLVIDRAVARADGTAMAWSVLGILVLFAVLTASAQFAMWNLTRAVVTAAHELRVRLVGRMLAGRGVSSTRQGGEVISIATTDTVRAAEVMEPLSMAPAATVGVVVSAVVLVRIDAVLGVGILVGVPLLLLALRLLSPLVERRTAAQQQAVGLAAGMATDLLTGLRALRGFGGTAEATRRYRAASRASLRASGGAIRARGLFLGATTVSTGLLLTAVTAVAGSFALQGRLSVGELITVVGLAAFVTDPIQHLARCVGELAGARASAARVDELLMAPTVLDRSGELVPDDQPLPIEVRTPAGSWTVAPGEVVGVVLTTVAAAEELLDALAGQPHADGPAVLVDGRPFSDYDHKALTDRLLVEPHRVDLLGAVLRDVVAVEDGSDDERIRAALDAASATDLGADLDRPLVERGLDLSGGQRQRIAVARALLADREITVFRDPTTAVDAVTEARMAAGLRAWRSGRRSTLLLTSSPALLDACDRVVFCGVDALAAGRHHDLLDLPAYATAVLR